MRRRRQGKAGGKKRNLTLRGRQMTSLPWQRRQQLPEAQRWRRQKSPMRIGALSNPAGSRKPAKKSTEHRNRQNREAPTLPKALNALRCRREGGSRYCFIDRWLPCVRRIARAEELEADEKDLSTLRRQGSADRMTGAEWARDPVSSISLVFHKH